MSLKIIPFDMGNIAKLAAAAVGPMIPVIAKYLPIGESLKSILGFLGG